MQPHETISAAITAANSDGRTALVPFMTAGYPHPETFAGTLVSISGVGDVVEIGHSRLIFHTD